MAKSPREQIANQNSEKSCHIVIRDRIYDVTDFVKIHPGGAAIILDYVGKDATQAFDAVHPSEYLEEFLQPKMHLRPLERGEPDNSSLKTSKEKLFSDKARTIQAQKEKPPLSKVFNVRTFEVVARHTISYKAWLYYSSAADDEITYVENMRAFSRFFFHPRILRPISQCNPATSILGFKSLIPVFVSPAAFAALGHPLGEANITRGCGRSDIIQVVSSNASLSYAKIAQTRVSPEQPLFFQLYKQNDDERAEQRVREVEALGYNAIFLTVDAPVPGNREGEMRVPFKVGPRERAAKDSVKAVEAFQDLSINEARGKCVGTDSVPVLDPKDYSWEKTIPWLRSVTNLPLVIKGIQCVEDAVLAADLGAEGILISNHGGRQLEYSMPPIEILHRLRKDHPDIFTKMEVFIDGGVRRGTDILKALCLGAKAVGLGRPFLYAQSAYGEAGVEKLVRILEREIVLGMRLLGARNVNDLVPEMVEKVCWQVFVAKL